MTDADAVAWLREQAALHGQFQNSAKSAAIYGRAADAIEENARLRAALEALVMLAPGGEGRCPVCRSPWSERETLAMREAASGACMCGRWSFDVHAALEGSDA